MSSRKIRIVALAAVRRDDGALLVQRGTAPGGGEFHRLIGGGVDFGETAEQAVVREWREELDTELTDVRLVGWLENRFSWAGRPAHELLAVHVGEVFDARVRDRDDLGVIPGSDSTVHWVPVGQLLDGPRPLYPEGVDRLLRPWLQETAG